MIGYLRGRVLAEEASSLVVFVNGVGYDVTTPAGTRGRAEGAEGVELWIHTHVREDALELFGFASELDRRAFRLLISVPNVGPKTAVGMLGALSVADLARAIQGRDLGRLGKVPGIGKRTAERLVVELTDKLAPLALLPGSADLPKAKPLGGPTEKLLKALVNMGYRPAEAERAVAELGPRVQSEPIGDLLRSALAVLTS